MADPIAVDVEMFKIRGRVREACAAMAARLGIDPPKVQPQPRHYDKHCRAMRELEGVAGFLERANAATGAGGDGEKGAGRR